MISLRDLQDWLHEQLAQEREALAIKESRKESTAWSESRIYTLDSVLDRVDRVISWS